jgi:transposase-like protein
MDKGISQLETWLRCKKCKRLTRHTSFSDNPEQLYKCQDCGEKRELVMTKNNCSLPLSALQVNEGLGKNIMVDK